MKSHFLCNPLSECYSTDSSRLRNNDPLEIWKHKFWDLSGLSTSRFSTYNDHRILHDCVKDLLSILEDGQSGRTVDLLLLINHKNVNKYILRMIRNIRSEIIFN